jgi:hypothetical protein
VVAARPCPLDVLRTRRGSSVLLLILYVGKDSTRASGLRQAGFPVKPESGAFVEAHSSRPVDREVAPLRILHLNSMLTGGGTDDRSVKIAHALMQLGHATWMAGPAGREFTATVGQLKIPFCPVPPKGPLKLPLILQTSKIIRHERIQILHARHGRDYWPAIFAALLSGVRPKVVLSRHLAKSPSSWVSRRYLLGRCDAMVAVSHFVA